MYNHALASQLAEDVVDEDAELEDGQALGAEDDEAAWCEERAHLEHVGTAASTAMQRAADAAQGQPHAVRPVAGRHKCTLPPLAIETKFHAGKTDGISSGVAVIIALRSPAIALGSRRRTYARSAPSRYPSIALEVCLAMALISSLARPRAASRWAPPRL